MQNSDVPNHLVPGSVYRLLMEVSILGTAIGEFSLAGDITRALADLRSELPYGSVAFAMNEFAAGRCGECVTRLEEALEKYPDNQLCRAMLGACMKMLGRSGWRGLLEEVIADNLDEEAVGFACAILGCANPRAAAGQDGGQANFGPAPSNAMWV
jgi:hypothetical protein